jgi:hypothetical protein
MKATFLSVRVVFILFIGFFLSSCGRDFPELLGMEKGIWYKMPPNKKDEYMATYSEIIHIRNTFSPNKIHLNRSLSVLISDGTAKMLPDFKAERFKPIMFVLNQDSCRKVDVISKDSDKTSSLKACFWGHELFLDPSNTDSNHALFSARLFESSLWQHFTYKHVSTTGYLGLTDVNIALKLIT